jgi:hypothetical protein
MLKIQEFIRCFDSIEEANIYLKRNLKIDVIVKGITDDDITTYLYKPAPNADLDNPIVREAHCLILDAAGNLLAKAWDHPRTITPPYSELIPDINNTTEELPDGRIVVVYNLDSEWVIATDSSADGDEYIPGIDLPGFTYEAEIKHLLSKRFGSWKRPFLNMHPSLCFIFSFISPYVDSVKPALTSELYLMSVINLEDEKELTIPNLNAISNKTGIIRPMWWVGPPGPNYVGMRLQQIRSLAPGMMIRSKEGDRFLVESELYKAVEIAKNAGDRIKPVHIARIVQSCKSPADMIAVGAAYPKFVKMLELLWTLKDAVWAELMSLWNVARDEKDTATFATIVKNHPLNYLLFMMRDRKIVTLKEGLANLQPAKLAQLAESMNREKLKIAQQYLTGGSTNGSSIEEDDRVPY